MPNRPKKNLFASLKAATQGRYDDVSATVLVCAPPHGEIISVNIEAEELTGYERQELEGMRLSDIFRAEDQERIRNIFAVSPQAAFNKLFEHNVIVRKRSRRKIIVDMGFRRTIFDGNEAWVFTLQDITDLKVNEERVVSAHEYVNDIIDSIVEVMLVVDGEHRIEKTNATATSLLGYDETDLIGGDPARVLPEIYGHGGRLLDLARTPQFAEMETYMVARDGRHIPVLLSRSGLRGHTKGHGTKAVLVATDITARKKSERLIAEQQMMLVQASKMSSLGEMASSIGHEINNPLTVILGRCDLLAMRLSDHEDDAAARDLDLITKMGRRILKIVRGLQALARDQRHDALDKANLATIIDDTLALCEIRVRDCVERFDLPVFKSPVFFNCKATQISQVLLNLINNSCDEVGGKPGAWIKLQVKSTKAALEISLTDSGHGIPEEVAAKIFQPFFTTKAIGKGTGIGLAISKSLVEAHGGTLTLDTSSKNTRFVITLPHGIAINKQAS